MYYSLYYSTTSSFFRQGNFERRLTSGQSESEYYDFLGLAFPKESHLTITKSKLILSIHVGAMDTIELNTCDSNT